MSSIFSKIVNGTIPAYIVAEDRLHIAILDAYPKVKGHVLVIPKKEVDYIFDISSYEYSELWKFSKRVAKSMRKVIKCKRIAVAVVGLEVPLTHIHLLPLNSMSDFNFDQASLKFSSSQMKSISDLIKSAI